MATCPVRFEFHCELAPEKLKYVHNVPARLVSPTAQAAQADPEYVRTFVAALQPIMQEHEVACRAASNLKCQSCGSPTVKVLQTPMSWMHIIQDPFVNVWVNPICGNAMCEFKVRQEIQDMMAVIASDSRVAANSTRMDGVPENIKEILPCKVCGKPDKTLRCGQCKVVAYCGKEHQKADWKIHKRICGELSQ
jgi:MYND finger